MNIREFEDFVRNQITDVVSKIISDNISLNISAKSRAGAEISDWLEKKFVEYTSNHKILKDAESAPEGKTKNPWDARVYYEQDGLREEIWIDFKAFKLSSIDSNPDIGTPNKVIKFISEGGFYLLYIHVYYEMDGDGLKFIKHDGQYTKSYFLKDISPTFRRTPTNQLQVNLFAEPEYRSRADFIDLIMKKIKEGLVRQLTKTEKQLKELDSTESMLQKANKHSEKVISNKIE